MDQTPFRCRAWLYLGLCLFLVSPILAQSDTAQISGFVRDPAGLGMPGASVVLTNEASQVERKTVTNDQGYYVFVSVPSGYYTLTCEMAGFKKFVKTRNKLDANVNLGIDAAMDIGEVNETVSVVAQASQLQSDTATVAKLIEQKQIETMMLNGRNPLYLATLKPGVRGTLASFGPGLTTAGLSINGGRTQDFLITFDGAVGVRTRANGTSIGTADVDTVSEVQILTANYNAEYGRSAGGQVRFISKSGGRDFHGSLYEYFRNDILDANSWSHGIARRNREAVPIGTTSSATS